MSKNDAPGAQQRTAARLSAKSRKIQRLFSIGWNALHLLLVNRYFAFFLFMLALSEGLGKMSSLNPLRSHLLTETPLLLAVYWALGFALRKSRLAPYVAAVPIVVLYVAYDIVFVAYGDVFRIIDLRSIPELFQVLPHWWQLALLFAMAAPVGLLLGFLDYRRYRRILRIGALALLFVLAVELFPRAVLVTLERAMLVLVDHSDAQRVNDNGRLTMTLYSEAKRRQDIAETAAYANRGDYPRQVSNVVNFIREHGNRRNLHVVVLESFVDPTLFAGVAFSQSPRHPDFADLVGDRLGFSISPVFGGETAQAEFEVLCGVPALHRLSNIEFNDFSGNAAGCMPGVLAQAGYATMVTNSFEPNYFNSTNAYTGIGFQNLYFPREYANARPTYFSTRINSDEEEYMFDGDLYDQNLQFVAKNLQEHPNRPMLNYVLGMYGHEPHNIDTTKRPLVIAMSAAGTDDQLLRAANQHWYRTQALARYLRGLIKLDPHSLIVVVSDHLPPLSAGVKTYQEFRYLDNVEDSTHLNRIVIVEDGFVVRHNTIHHYEISSLIYDYLTGNQYCKKNDCHRSDEVRAEEYMTLMAHAVGLH